MSLYVNELGEFVEPYEPPPLLKLKPCDTAKLRRSAREQERDRRHGPHGKQERPANYAGEAGERAACPVCGAGFVRKTTRHRYCSKACRKKSERREKR